MQTPQDVQMTQLEPDTYPPSLAVSEAIMDDDDGRVKSPPKQKARSSKYGSEEEAAEAGNESSDDDIDDEWADSLHEGEKTKRRVSLLEDCVRELSSSHYMNAIRFEKPYNNTDPLKSWHQKVKVGVDA